MRVPFYSSQGQFTRDIANLKHRQVQLNHQLSTGQRVSSVTDDPAAAGRAMNAAEQKGKIQTYARNIMRADTVGSFTIEALQVFKGLTDTAYDLTLTNDGLSDSTDMLAREADLRQLVEQSLHTMNTKLGNDFIFAGANTSETPYNVYRYTEYLEDADGNYVDLTGAAIALGDPPVPSVLRDTDGSIIFDPVLSPSGNAIAEGTYVDPATGNQTDSGGTPLPGPVALDAGIDFNTGELIELDSGSGTWGVVLDAAGDPVVPQDPDPSGTGFMTLTRSMPADYIGQAYAVEYTGTTDSTDDPRFRVAENSQVSAFSRGQQNAGYATILNSMITLRDAFNARDLDSVQSASQLLNQTEDDVITGIVEMGARVKGLSSLERVNTSRFNELETLISSSVDADIAETIVDLNQNQTAYEAALSSAARVMNLSLMDYL